MISFNAFMLVYDKRTTPSHRQRNLSSEIGLFFASHWFNRLSSTMVSVQEILAQSDLERNGAQDCGHKARLSWRIFHFLDAKYLSRLLVNQPNYHMGPNISDTNRRRPFGVQVSRMGVQT